MSSIFVKIEQEVLDFLKGAGKIVEPVVISVVQALVVAAKATPLGTLAMSLIQIFENHEMTGDQKMESVIGALVPAITAMAATGGIPAIVGSVEGFARELAQSAYNDLKATGVRASFNAAVNDLTAAKA